MNSKTVDGLELEQSQPQASESTKHKQVDAKQS